MFFSFWCDWDGGVIHAYWLLSDDAGALVYGALVCALYTIVPTTVVNSIYFHRLVLANDEPVRL